jgi:CheY-like chemotaxis protein
MTNTAPVRILIADDDTAAAEMLAEFVKGRGDTPYLAHDGAMALRMGADLQPDVILLDISMPGMNGYETCRQLRANPRSAGAFIVALTGWGQDQDKQRAMRSGFDAHLTKPADLEMLATLLADRSER